VLLGCVGVSCGGGLGLVNGVMRLYIAMFAGHFFCLMCLQE
jgi:hypothetical protein